MVTTEKDAVRLPDQEYDMRLLWKDEWEYSSFATRFDAEGNYTGPDYEDATISSQVLDDGRIQLKVDKIFDQDICSDMGW